MGRYDDIQVPIGGTPISSANFGVKVRDAILDLDERVSSIDTSSGTGIASSTSSLFLSTTAETVFLTVTGMTFLAGLAYEVRLRSGLGSAAVGTLVHFRIRKWNATPASGADWGEFYRYRAEGGPIMSLNGAIFLINNTNLDVTSDVNIIAQSSVAAANAITLYANANSARSVLIRPVGFAADFAGMGVQVT